MAKSAAWMPSKVQSVGAMQDTAARVEGWCSKCGQVRQVDYARLIASKGREYSLINRRTRCKLTAGCNGWVKFHYLHGVMRPLFDEGQAHKWNVEKRA